VRACVCERERKKGKERERKSKFECVMWNCERQTSLFNVCVGMCVRVCVCARVFVRKSERDMRVRDIDL